MSVQEKLQQRLELRRSLDIIQPLPLPENQDIKKPQSNTEMRCFEPVEKWLVGVWTLGGLGILSGLFWLAHTELSAHLIEQNTVLKQQNSELTTVIQSLENRQKKVEKAKAKLNQCMEQFNLEMESLK